MSSRRKIVVTLSVLLLIVAAAAALGVWRLLGGAPEEVSLADAVADAELAQAEPSTDGQSQDGDIQNGDIDNSNDADTALTTEAVASTTLTTEAITSTTAASSTTSTTDAGTDAGTDASTGVDGAAIEGTWAVDAETGDFTLEDATGSFVGFRVEEELARIGAFTAVGRTGDVSGTMEIADEHVTAAEIVVELATLRTDDRRRDAAVHRALGLPAHPTATFVLTEELHVENAAASGEIVQRTAAGDLTVNGITRPVQVDIQAQLVGDIIAVVGSTQITFADFDVTVPQVPVVLRADDHGIMEFQLLFRRHGSS